MDAASHVRHRVRGLQGIVQLLEGDAAEGLPIDQTTLANLDHWRARLDAVRQLLAGQVGADLAGRRFGRRRSGPGR